LKNNKNRAFFIQLLFLVFITITNTLCAQTNYVLPNEVVLFSFKTDNGKIVTINKDKDDKYIVYRFGTKNKVELQYPDTLKNDWNDFTYSYYLRGGGQSNEGMELNYLYFTTAGFQYVIYNTYYSSSDKTTIGIKIINIKTAKTNNIIGVYKSRKGDLTKFRDNTLIGKSDELFE